MHRPSLFSCCAQEHVRIHPAIKVLILAARYLCIIVQRLVSLRVLLHRIRCSGAGSLIADYRLEDEIWDCRSRALRRSVQDGGEGGLSLAR